MQSSEPYSAVPSFWAATANAHPELPHLEADLDTDVAIVGGGFTGLTTAHYLNRSGIDCAVLEANDAGWVANRWCEILPISLAAKQKLMELTDPLVRLQLVDEFLRGKGVVK